MPWTHAWSEKTSFEQRARETKNEFTLSITEVHVKHLQPLFLSSLLSRSVAALVTSVLTLPAMAQDLRIAVLTDHLVLGGRAYTDFDLLASAVDALRPRTVGLDACGETTDRPLRAAAYRLRHLPLQLRSHEASDAECAGQSAAVVSASRQPLRIDVGAVDRYWLGLAP